MAGRDALYIAFDNPMGGDVQPGDTWGKCDAVEVALGGKGGIVLLRGYVGGKWESSTEGGLSKAAAEQAAQGIRYAAQTTGKDRWTAEWEIPWSSLGLDKPSGAQLPLNLTVRKVAANQWVMWQGTGGWSWQADKAGLLRLP